MPFIVLAGLRSLVRGQRLDRERVDFTANQLAQGLVDQLVAGNQALAGKASAHDTGGEMGLILGQDLDFGVR